MQDKDDVMEEQDPLKTKTGRTYLKALQFAVEVGAVSSLSIQKHLNVNAQTADEMLSWMLTQGFVKEEEGKLKTTLMREEEFSSFLQTTGYSLRPRREKQRTVDDGVYKACLRLAIRKGYVNAPLLKSAFALGNMKAQAVLKRMRDDGYLGYIHMGEIEVTITKEKFKEIYGEEI